MTQFLINFKNCIAPLVLFIFQIRTDGEEIYSTDQQPFCNFLYIAPSFSMRTPICAWRIKSKKFTLLFHNLNPGETLVASYKKYNALKSLNYKYNY